MVKRRRWLLGGALLSCAACAAVVIALGGPGRLRHLAVPVLTDPSEPPPEPEPLATDTGWGAEDLGRLPGRVTALVESADGVLWAGTFGQGLYRWAQGAAPAEAQALEGPQRLVNALLAGEDGSVWVGTARGLVHLAADGKLQGVTLPDLAVMGLASEGARIFAGTGGGCFTADGAGPLGGPEGAGLRVYALLAAGGSIWLGTPGGLYALREDRLEFHPLVFGPAPATSNTVEALARIEGGVVAATDDGGPALVTANGEVRALRFAETLANAAAPGAAASLGPEAFVGTPVGVLRLWVGADGRLAAARLSAAVAHISALAAAGTTLLVGADDGRVFRVGRIATGIPSAWSRPSPARSR